MSSYEFPFNERIRTYLRLEDLFTKVLHHVEIGHEFNHHAALVSLLQMLDLIDRADLKVDLLQELDRHKIQLSFLQGNPNIDQHALSNTLASLERCAVALRTDHQKLGQTLRENDWLMSIKQRTGIPGGVCEFDLPSYHHWLYLSPDRRKADFDNWLSRLMPMYEAISIILQLLRGSGQTLSLVAHHGAYQQQLSGHKPAQLLRIEIGHTECFPEVSANKYAINIRFQKLDFVQKPKVLEEDIPFNMIVCNFTGAGHN
ncbi:cell division protein ZapD [Methylophilus aquaticus]|uniref:Cell division protein ZapD n=1 Tax=Methylophilus aquaticus TaxID=1971610 RepID=A0ABT9JQW1_9PROT|nr:cell division protein ZapD [Methylophilus aquaticus]MDP8566947.1 cell division protein ZapD [Methylophilus aquaticus]